MPYHYHTITLSYLTLPYITLPYITLPYITLPYMTLHYLTLPYIALHYRTLPYITLPYLTSHHITSHHIHTYIRREREREIMSCLMCAYYASLCTMGCLFSMTKSLRKKNLLYKNKPGVCKVVRTHKPRLSALFQQVADLAAPSEDPFLRRAFDLEESSLYQMRLSWGGGQIP